MLRLFSALLFCLILAPSLASAKKYDLEYRAQLQPDTGLAQVEIILRGEELPHELSLNLSSGRYRELRSAQPLEQSGKRATWKPQAPESRLRYQFVIDEQKSSGSYDSHITKDWAILRSDKLIPPMAVVADRDLRSRATLQLELPKGWSSLLPYPELEDGRFQLRDPGRRFIRPKGWMIAGKIGSRQDMIGDTKAVVAAPLGEHIRRQDTLAFLNWNLPELKKVFPGFPDYVLVVMAGDPMWRGGLSGTRSLFMHADRPLISGNRTSSLLHELVHVATGIRGDKESDWIVEGLAEYYSLETLRRSGGISELRYQETLNKLAEWGREAPSLLIKRSSGPVTARAVGVMHTVDQQIRRASGNKSSLDDVARELAKGRGQVSLKKFRKLAEQAAGEKIEALSRENLSRPADG